MAHANHWVYALLLGEAARGRTIEIEARSVDTRPTTRAGGVRGPAY